jgi:cell division protein FtsX
MKLVGAKLLTLKLPILMYGILIGLISGLISLCVNAAIIYLINKILMNSYFPIAVNVIYFSSIGLGIVLGFLGSYLSAKKITLFVGE